MSTWRTAIKGQWLVLPATKAATAHVFAGSEVVSLCGTVRLLDVHQPPATGDRQCKRCLAALGGLTVSP